MEPEGGSAPPPRRHRMVDWYDPLQLIKTGVQVLIWNASGQGRPMEDIAQSQGYFSYTEGKELWFDYLADTGDGWNPTYAIASLVAQRELRVGDLTLPHGRFLVLGGDEVYPTPSQKSYRERFVGPFESALPRTDPPHPHLFAIPGNHDWYDGLVSFSRRFTQERRIGGWLTRQARSYFALRLPQHWWLWAVDVLPESDIDYGQREYFRRMADNLGKGDRVILVSAKPDWIYRNIKEPVAESNLGYFEAQIEKRDAAVYLWLAGDLHHYRRHENVKDERFQRITSGGGGAFLHPTHRPAKRKVLVGEKEFVLKATFPDPATSFRLSLLNLLFLVKNWKLGILTGIAYAAFTWAPPAKLADLFNSPASLVSVAVILAGFVLYADEELPWFRWVGGLVHGCAHLAAAFAIVGWASREFEKSLGLRLLLSFLGGGIAGPTILGLYLLLALNLFGAHGNEAFSSLRIQDYKHFLRLHITPEGKLKIYPIGIKRIPRGDEAHAGYTLIEDPVEIKP